MSLPEEPDNHDRGEGSSREIVRVSPPWTDGPYSSVTSTAYVRVGYADGFYILQALGGHIIGSTQSIEELAKLVQLECERGLRAVEINLRGEPSHACASIGDIRDGRRAKGRAARPVLETLSLEDLGI